MKLKKEFLILVLVIVALALYLGLRNKGTSHDDLPQPEALESSRIDRIVIASQEASLDLVKKDDQWTLQPQGYPADKAKVTNMLTTIAKLKVTAVVSESGNYERYDLTDDEKVAVQAYSGNTLVREFNIGQSAPTFRHTFVTLAGDPKVYHGQGAFKTSFDQTVEDLRDKSVMTFDQAAITGVEIQKGDQILTAARVEVTPPEPTDPESSQSAAAPEVEWRTTQGELLDKEPLEALMGSLSNLQCQAFVNDRSKSDFTSALWSVTFRDAANEYTLSLFAKPDEDDMSFPAVASTNPHVFSLPESQVETFEKHLDALTKGEKKEESTSDS
jgi:hypothetical protein